jgi:hypothetical protein
MSAAPKPPSPQKAARAERLAAALRANLKRRKAAAEPPEATLPERPSPPKTSGRRT